MSTYREEKILEKAADLLVEMERSNCEPNSFTCCILMDGLCKDGRVEEAMTWLEKMRRKGLEVDVTLVNGFRSKGCLDRGKALFDEMLEKGISQNLVAYSCLMNGFCKKGLWREATAVLQTITDRGVQPDVHACMIAGLCKR